MNKWYECLDARMYLIIGTIFTVVNIQTAGKVRVTEYNNGLKKFRTSNINIKVTYDFYSTAKTVPDDGRKSQEGAWDSSGT